MWRFEKTDQGQDLVWDGAQTGIAPGPLLGTANLQNVNIATEPGEVMASYARSNQAQTAISSGTLTPDGATLLDAPSTLKSGTWIKVTASTVSSISAATNPTTLSIDYLIVGGGGAGGAAIDTVGGGGGGGGGGEVVTGTTSVSVGNISVSVGAGGVSSTTGTGSSFTGGNGEDSTLESIDTAVGGGGGGGCYLSNQYDGNGGASGGGGGANGTGSTTGGTATAGFDGGDTAASATSGGGGGGAGAIGQDSSGGDAGDGGVGVASSLSGTSVTYGSGGGGGGTNTSGAGGTGGGSGGVNAAGNDATGYGNGGGGGADNNNSASAGGDGSSGIVIVRYVTGSAIAIGGTVTHDSGYTIHTYTEDGFFELLWINPGGLYYVSYKDDSDQIKLSDTYDPYGADVVTHGTTGSITFDTLTTPGQPIAKAYEMYGTDTTIEYRYYILDADGYVWVYDTLVYETTLADNNVGVTWMLPDPTNYENALATGIGVLNGWLMLITNKYVLGKPTVILGTPVLFMYGGYLTNSFPNHRNYVLVGSQGTLLYTDGNFIGEIFPTTSLVTSEANIQSYVEYTASSTAGTIATLINGSLPSTAGGSRVPAVFFTSDGGALPTALDENTVYYIDYDYTTQTFSVYTSNTETTKLDIATGASGTQYFNTFYPVGPDAGSNGTNPLVQFTPQRLNLPFFEQANCLVEIGNQVLVGCKGNTVYPWNQVDAIPSDVIALPEGDVKAMINVNNTAYIFPGDKGNIYITNGSVASLTLKVPDYIAGVPGTPNSYIEPYFVWGDAAYVRGRVYFSILDQTATKAGNCGGVWSFIPSQNIDPSQNVGLSLRLENQNSYADYDGYAPIIITDQEQDGNSPKYWAAWQDSYNTASAGFGIDYSTENPVTTYVIETDLIPTGTFLTKNTYTQLEYKLALPLQANETIAVSWRTTPRAAWTSAGTSMYEADDHISGYYNVNFQKTQYLQFRIVVTTTGSAATSYFAPFKELRLR